MSRPSPTAARAFTLIELMVVIAIILVVIGIASSAYIGVKRKSFNVATEATMTAMANGIDMFKADMGYIPPLMLDAPEVNYDTDDWCTVVTSREDAANKLREERYHSITSLSVYLVGIGELSPNPTATDVDRHDGHGGPGFRDPGIDRAWGGARERSLERHTVTNRGRVFGPYLEVGDSDIVRKSEASDYPEDSNLTGSYERMSVILDAWGTPIRYYRFWPTTDADTGDASLIDAPAELVDPEALIEGLPTPDDFRVASDPELARGEYALLSAGRDRVFTHSGFAAQKPDPDGWVSDFLGLGVQEGGQAYRAAFEDNVRMVR